MRRAQLDHEVNVAAKVPRDHLACEELTAHLDRLAQWYVNFL